MALRLKSSGQVARERPDIPHAQHRVKAKVLLNLKTEALHIRDVAIEVEQRETCPRCQAADAQCSVPTVSRLPKSKRGLMKNGGCSTDGKITLFPRRGHSRCGSRRATTVFWLPKTSKAKPNAGPNWMPRFLNPPRSNLCAGALHTVDGVARAGHDAAR